METIYWYEDFESYTIGQPIGFMGGGGTAAIPPSGSPSDSLLPGMTTGSVCDHMDELDYYSSEDMQGGSVTHAFAGGWFYLNANARLDMCLYDTSTYEFVVEITFYPGYSQLVHWPGGMGTQIPGTSWTTGQWYEIFVEYDESTMTYSIWFDGTEYATDSAFFGSASDVDRLIVMGDGTTDAFIDNCMHWTQDEPEYIPHLPIRINSNADFDEAHGVVNWNTGNGTIWVPWVIENYDINGTGYGYCIFIGNTTDYFIVTNCSLHYSSGVGNYPYYPNSGLILHNVQNSLITRNIVSFNNEGIRLYSSNGNQIISNNASNNEYGISLETSYNNIVVNNTMNLNNYHGLSLWESENCIIVINTESNNIYYGICFAFSNNNTIVNNTASNNKRGIFFHSSQNNSICNNNVTSNNAYGIYFQFSSKNNIVYHNNFINNSNQAYNDGTNQWDDGYPSGGNYWSDNNGTDLFSGPDQNIPGSDGIGDTPYTNIQGGTGAQDNYPLMSPWVPPVPEEFTILLSPGWNLVSIPLEMVDTSIPNVLASISGQYDAVKYFSSTDASDPWKTYRPNGTMNDFANINNTMGFWVHATAYCNLTVTGEIPATTQINLHAGWNLVGYPAQTEMMMSTALWGTGADRVEAFDSGSPYLISEVGPNYIMKPGEGYWIHVPADSVWTVNW